MFLVFALAAAPFAYDGSLQPGQTLTIRDINGSVQVRSGDKLSVRATRTARYSDPNSVAIHVEQRRDGLIVCVRYPPDAEAGCDARHDHSSSNNDTKVEFDVTIPRGVALDAATVNGSIEARTEGAIDAHTVNGTIRAEGRDVHRVATVNGSIHLRILDRPTGSLEAKTVNGSIDVSLPPGTGLAINAHTLTGGIDAPGVNIDHPRYGPGASARGTIGEGGVAVSLDTVNGSITLH